MKFVINSTCLAEGMEEKRTLLDSFTTDYLKKYFERRYYGEDVQKIWIHVILVNTPQGWKHLIKAHRPRYYDDFEHVYADGTTIRCKKEFDIEIGFDNELYDSFLAADEEQAKKILARETLKALELLDKLPKKVKDFDKESFKRDVESLYRSHGWIE